MGTQNEDIIWGQTMDPHEFVEKILSGQLPTGGEIDSAFDITEILDEVRQADRAMDELQTALISIESDTSLRQDTIKINRLLEENKLAMEIESVDAAYEM
jgi:hypothetical protein